MLIEFNVNNQKLERITKDLFLADQSNNIIQCRFLFNGDDWIGKQRFVLLHNYQCQTYQLHLDETNTIIIPYDIVIKEKFSISLYGEDETEERITTNVVTLRLDPSGFTTDYTDIVDNLTTNDSEKPLSAKQGKAIADMIGNIQLYVNR